MRYRSAFLARISALLFFDAMLMFGLASEFSAQTLPIALGKAAEVTKIAKAAAAAADERTGPFVSVFIDGSIKGTDKKTDETKTANGALAFSIQNTGWDAALSINIASKRDTITSAFGQSLLVPGSGGFYAGNIEVRKSISASVPSLFARGYLGASSLLWSVPSSTDSTKKNVRTANAIGSGLGISWQIVDGTLKVGDKETSVNARLDFSGTRRALHGSVMNDDFVTDRVALLKTEKNVFYGFEVGAQMQYSTVRGSIVYYSFPNAKGADGLTRGQVTAGFAIAAPIAEGRLKR